MGDSEEPSASANGDESVRFEPRLIRFTKRVIDVRGDIAQLIKALEPIPGHATDALVLDASGDLFRLHLSSGDLQKLTSVSPEMLRLDLPVQMVVSRGGIFVALTATGRANNASSTGGVVLDLESSMPVLRLDCGEYHTEHAPFPVAFLERSDRTLVIHATDWNRVDVTDPRTGECLTERQTECPDDEEWVRDGAPEDPEFTEWLGELRVSPDGRLVATIGWMWHPVGVAFSWSIENWLDGNAYEPDDGPSKRIYTYWGSYWFSPFCWVDSQTLCVWGDSEKKAFGDVPPNSVVLYDAATGKSKGSFVGPSIGGFYFDRYLFTETSDPANLSVWDVQKGALIHVEPGIAPRAYHPGLSEFIEVTADGWTAWRWSDGEDDS